MPLMGPQSQCRKCGQHGHIARFYKDSNKGETFRPIISTFVYFLKMKSGDEVLEVMVGGTNRTIVEMAQFLLFHGNLPKGL